MSANSGLLGAIKAQDNDRKYMNWTRVSLASVFVYEQLAFILDEAQAALMRPSIVTCERALKRIAEMTEEALPLAANMLALPERDDTLDDILQELKRKASKRKGWCPEKTPIMRELEEEAK